MDREKCITIEVRSISRQIIVADNGPGVNVDDEAYIFEPFYSSKGDQGKGLGLYIARQVGNRHGFGVTYEKNASVLAGANFVISFDEVNK
jgi:signal transduction histidine kinase